MNAVDRLPTSYNGSNRFGLTRALSKTFACEARRTRQGSPSSSRAMETLRPLGVVQGVEIDHVSCPYITYKSGERLGREGRLVGEVSYRRSLIRSTTIHKSNCE
jgi:hypothetical protein